MILVPNVYKVLLARGMVGTIMYSTDAETRDAVRVLTRARTATSRAGGAP